ncbi:MAG: sigma 54-interacting transcriptional regulator, partial [Sphingomonadales bacterium]
MSPNPKTDSGIHQVILSGPSAQARKLKISVERAGNSRSSVLIYGEPGAGKETIARLIHENLAEKGRFIAFYIFEDSEEEFIDLLKRHSNLGPKAKANSNTLFLDGVNELSSTAQRRLSIFLKNIEGRGGLTPKILSTSTQDILGLVKYSAFSRELYWQLNVQQLSLPNLQHRKSDIPIIFKKLLKATFAPKRAPIPSREAIKALVRYGWPGNLRELKSVATRFHAMDLGGKITRRNVTTTLANPLSTETGLGRGQNLSSAIYRNLEKYFKAHEGALPPAGLYQRILKEVERPLISLTLNATKGNQL